MRVVRSTAVTNIFYPFFAWAIHHCLKVSMPWHHALDIFADKGTNGINEIDYHLASHGTQMLLWMYASRSVHVSTVFKSFCKIIIPTYCYCLDLGAHSLYKINIRKIICILRVQLFWGVVASAITRPAYVEELKIF